jgi:tRNA A37 threonylcarbamoyladenosine dehydratase
LSFVFRPSPVSPNGRGRVELEATIVLVGCGGTGGFVAEALCRLLLGRRASLFLVDPDRVEAANVSRQAFL